MERENRSVSGHCKRAAVSTQQGHFPPRSYIKGTDTVTVKYGLLCQQLCLFILCLLHAGVMGQKEHCGDVIFL